LVDYKLFLYKIRINCGYEAQRNDGSVVVREGGGIKFGHYGRKAGPQSRSHDNQTITSKILTKI